MINVPSTVPSIPSAAIDSSRQIIRKEAARNNPTKNQGVANPALSIHVINGFNRAIKQQAHGVSREPDLRLHGTYGTHETYLQTTATARQSAAARRHIRPRSGAHRDGCA